MTNRTRATKPRAVPILFLDFDGVISYNDDTYTLSAQQRLRPECVRRLDAIIRRTGAHVVVSSTWRETFGPAKLCSFLEASGFSGQVIDVTPIMPKAERWQEIEAWLKAQAVQPKAIAILEDYEPMRHLSKYTVRTNYDRGLTDADVERAVDLLTVKCVATWRRRLAASCW